MRLECRLNAYVDDELDAVHCLEVEDHLQSCSECDERVTQLRATRSSLRRACKTRAPAALRQRLANVMEQERTLGMDGELDLPLSMREPAAAVRPVSEQASPSLTKLRYIVPLAAAATVALVFGAIELQRQQGEMASGPSTTTSAAGSSFPARLAGIDNLLEDLVQQHIQSPPLDTTDPEQVSHYEPRIGVRVRAPRLQNARWEGARMQRSAALMRYMRNRRRITLYMFDAKRVPVQSKRLRVAGHQGASNVYVGRVRGYNVAASECDGVGYALASDLSDKELTQMLVSAVNR